MAEPRSLIQSAWDAVPDREFFQDVGAGLRDAVGRGVVAGTLCAPVDMAAMAMRPFGYKVENPILGSEWIGDKMQDAGMISGRRSLIGEAFASLAGPAAAVRAGPAVFRAEQAMAKNAAAPAKLNKQSGVLRLGDGDASALPMDAASRAQRMAAMEMERGWYRGGPEIKGEKRSGPWYTSDPLEAAGYAKRAPNGGEVREYALPAKKYLNADSSYFSKLAHDVANLIDNDYYGKQGKFLAENLRTFGPKEGISGGQLWQSLEKSFGNDGAAEILSKLRLNGEPAFTGVKGIAGPDEVMVFANSPVRDAEKAVFDPSKKAIDNIYGGATVPFMGTTAAATAVAEGVRYGYEQESLKNTPTAPLGQK